jgi:hypothetical protein
MGEAIASERSCKVEVIIVPSQAVDLIEDRGVVCANYCCLV